MSMNSTREMTQLEKIERRQAQSQRQFDAVKAFVRAFPLRNGREWWIEARTSTIKAWTRMEDWKEMRFSFEKDVALIKATLCQKSGWALVEKQFDPTDTKAITCFLLEHGLISGHDAVAAQKH